MPRRASLFQLPSRAAWGLTATVLLLSACSQQPVPGAPTPVPTEPTGVTSEPPAEPSPSPTPARYASDFEGAALGSVPAEFVDVTTEEETPSWVYAGKWAVAADDAGNRVLLHDDVRQQPAVSFLRYRGTALGTENGQVPEVYFAEVAMRPLKSPHNYPPTGDQGVQFFYLAHHSYLEVIIKPDVIEVWEANQAAPNTSKGWKRLWHKALATKAGDVRRIGALVDTRAGTFTATLDGAALGTVKSPLLTPRPAWVALRGIGNVVSFDDMVIEPR